MSKNKNKFVKQDSSNNSPLQVLLVPVSIVLAGVIVAVSFLIGSSAIISNMKTTIETSVAKAVQTAGLNPAITPTEAPVTITAEQVKSLFNNKNITFGDANKKVVFVEFSDPSCPYCHAAGGHNPELNKQIGTQFILTSDGGTYVAPVPEMKKLVDEGKAAFVWAYNNGHGNGELGSQALYCAHETGKFWPVHDKLMSSSGYDLLNNTVKNDKANSGTLANFLKDAIDENTLKSCLESGKYASKLAEDEQLAASFGSSGTPGFFINTTSYPGAYSYKDMEAAVSAALGS